MFQTFGAGKTVERQPDALFFSRLQWLTGPGSGEAPAAATAPRSHRRDVPRLQPGKQPRPEKHAADQHRWARVARGQRAGPFRKLEHSSRAGPFR